jgi:cellulose synthase/poly-beta-1,6-N-acetylglucosamine synthase-like glycosyltransferase
VSRNRIAILIVVGLITAISVIAFIPISANFSDISVWYSVTSAILLATMLFWGVYNGYILFAGVRRKVAISPFDGKIDSPPKVSLIVPTKDEETVIRRCLDALVRIDYPKDKLEIIIVEGNSKDSTYEICRQFEASYPGVFKVIKENASRGKPSALNLALPVATGEIIGLFDADSVPEKQVLNKVASYFKDPKIVALQGRTVSINEKYNILTRVTAMEEKAWFQALVNGREKLKLFVPLTGSCQFVRRQILDELGGWDETSLTEDVELALRLVEKKHLIKYAPDVCSGQETPNNLGDLVRQRVRWYRGYMETSLKYGRLLNDLNKKTVDAEISLISPFLMVASLFSYVNWGVAVLLSIKSGLVFDLTGVVIALTALSFISVGIALVAVEKPFAARKLFWIPSIYVYWFLQICIAALAFFKMLFRRRRVWTKTTKKGFIASNYSAECEFPR